MWYNINVKYLRSGESKKIIKYYDKFFLNKEKNNCMIFHTDIDEGRDFHIDVAHYTASEKCPYQVLATFGASIKKDRGMPYVEYITFLPKDYDLNIEENRFIVCEMISQCQYFGRRLCNFEVREIINDDQMPPNANLTHCFVLPQAVVDYSDFGYIKINLFKKIEIMHILPICQNEFEIFKEEGPWFLFQRIYANDESENFLYKEYRW